MRFRVAAFDEVRTPRAREFHRLLATPCSDPSMVAGKQDRRYRPSLPFCRAGVLGIFEQAVRKTLRHPRLGIAHDPGQKADDGVEDDHCRELAAGKDIIADGDLLEALGRDDPLVDALETAGNED